MTEYEILENINKCKRNILGTRLFGIVIIVIAVLSYLFNWNTFVTLGIVIPSSLFIFLGVGLPAMLRLSRHKKELVRLQNEKI